MTSRRDVVVGLGCASAAAITARLRRREYVAFLRDAEIQNIVPQNFSQWSMSSSGGLIRPKVEIDLSGTIYSEVVERTYINTKTLKSVMLLIAYGREQTDLLQIHRPENCYPAFGFTITRNSASTLEVNSQLKIGARVITAESASRLEHIKYWARLGDFFPVTQREQRERQLQLAMSGYVADGILVRASVLGGEAVSGFQILDEFLLDLIEGVQPLYRAVFVGASNTQRLQSSPSTAEGSS